MVGLARTAFLVGTAAGLVQGVEQAPKPGPITPYASYGPPEPVELEQIAAGDETNQGKKVLTKGDLRALGGRLDYYILADGTARVLLIPVPELADSGALRRLLGRHVELTGVVRALPPQQRTVVCRDTMMIESKCKDPELPALPNAQVNWPSISITVLALSDVGPIEAAPEAPESGVLEELATNGAQMAGQTVQVIGTFAGRNLFGDLPAGSESTPADWVLRSGPHAIWVTGRKPEGKGWRLDPAYKGDAVRWLAVTGRVETRGGVTFVRASKVTLVSAPTDASAVP